MCIYNLDQPVYGKQTVKHIPHTYTHTRTYTRDGKQSQLQSRWKKLLLPTYHEASGECEFGDHILPILPPNASRPINSQIHYSQDKGQGKSQDDCIRSCAVLLGTMCDWCPLWDHKSGFLLFLHMYTLNSCHFFLYLLWIFKKCYQSTCFTIFLLSFLPVLHLVSEKPGCTS